MSVFFRPCIGVLGIININIDVIFCPYRCHLHHYQCHYWFYLRRDQQLAFHRLAKRVLMGLYHGCGKVDATLV